MKRGILFFYNMGTFTTIGRIALLPLIWMLTKFIPPAYYVCLVLFVISLILTVIPAPADRTMLQVIEKHREETNRQMREISGIRNEEKFVILHAYRKKGAMKLRRRVGRDVIYPHLASFVFAEHGDKKFLMIAKKSLLKATPTEYELIKLHDASELESFRVEWDPDAKSEAVAQLTLYTKNAPEGITVFAKNDYHYRDFVKAMQSVAR